MLRETRGALFASDSADADASFEATAAISLPRACRPVPPRSNAKTAADAPADLPAKAVGFAAALAFGRAFPPAPPTEDGLTAPAAWHPSRPILATVDGEGQLLIHHDPARESLGTPAGARRAPAASATALRHASHPRARALAWRPRAGATLAVAGGDGVCLWSRDPGASGAVGDATPANAASGGPKHNARASPPWRIRRLHDDCDDAPPVAERDPFRHAGVSTGLANAARAVSETARAAAAALARLLLAAPGTETPFFARREKFENASSRSARSARSVGAPPPYDTVAWSPDGRLLAAGSRDRSGVSVWEVGTGKRVAVASGARGVAFLSFSNCGEYVCAAHARDGFTVWETEGWRSAFWGTEGRAVTAVAWGPRGGLGPGEGSAGEPTPRGATALVAVEGGGARLSAAHFSRGAPSLVAQVLPVDLPRAVLPERPFSGGTLGGESVSRGAGGDSSRGESPEAPSRDAAKPTASPDVAHMSWDPSGRRLAVAFADAPAGTHVFPAGAVGLFSTRLAPVIRASLVGYVTAGASFANHGSDERGGNVLDAAPPGPARAALLSGPGGAAGCRAPGDAAEAATTLAACWEGGGVSVVPVFA